MIIYVEAATTATLVGSGKVGIESGRKILLITENFWSELSPIVTYVSLDYLP